jgi:hypothetical protein
VLVGLAPRQPCKQSAVRLPADTLPILLANEGIDDLRFLAFILDNRLPRTSSYFPLHLPSPYIVLVFNSCQHFVKKLDLSGMWNTPLYYAGLQADKQRW